MALYISKSWKSRFHGPCITQASNIEIVNYGTIRMISWCDPFAFNNISFSSISDKGTTKLIIWHYYSMFGLKLKSSLSAASFSSSVPNIMSVVPNIQMVGKILLRTQFWMYFSVSYCVDSVRQFWLDFDWFTELVKKFNILMKTFYDNSIKTFKWKQSHLTKQK